MAEDLASNVSQKRRVSLAQSDISKYRNAFNAYMDQKDGKLEIKRINEVAERVGYRLPADKYQELMEKNNLDNNSRITFEQFLDLIPRNTSEISNEQHRLAELREKFQRYDVDKNGYITLNEAQWALQMELGVSQQTAFRLLNQFVKLNYEQFMEFYEQIQQKKMDIYEKFGQYDQDGDGLVSVEEAHRILHEEFGFNKERSRAMVNRFDVNKDGQMSYIEFAEFYMAVEDRKRRVRAAFQLFDKDQRGFVSVEQACHILQGYLGFSEEKAKHAVKLYDKNNDGIIDYEEFLEFFSMIEEERQRLLSEFTQYDTDGDGQLSYGEFKDMLSSKGYTEREIQTLIAGYHLDPDGYLNFDEFKQFLNFS